MRKFLRALKLSEQFLSTWSGDETKREFLDRLFLNLAKAKKGEAFLRACSRALCEQASFPDLAGWEDSTIKQNAARESIEALKSYEKQINEKRISEKDKAAARERYHLHRENVLQRQVDLEKLRNRLEIELTPKLGTPEGGYDFERWFYELSDFFEITSRRPYNTGGRQIDGSLTLDGTTYLIELKFTNSPTEAPDMDVFFKKVIEKADNTMGLFVSISGFTRGAIKSASVSRTPLLLLDHRHVFTVLASCMTLPDMIARVRRHASQTGEAYLSMDKIEL